MKGWQYPESGDGYPEPRTIESIGWVMSIDPTHVVVTGHRSRPRAVLNPLAIPRGCILKFEEIE